MCECLVVIRDLSCCITQQTRFKVTVTEKHSSLSSPCNSSVHFPSLVSPPTADLLLFKMKAFEQHLSNWAIPAILSEHTTVPRFFKGTIGSYLVDRQKNNSLIHIILQTISQACMLTQYTCYLKARKTKQMPRSRTSPQLFQNDTYVGKLRPGVSTFKSVQG